MVLKSGATYRELLQQRSTGSIISSFGPRGLLRHREEGCLKLRLPKGGTEAIFINTSGGLAGGDLHALNFELAEGTNLTITGQSAERVYGSLGPAAEIKYDFRIAANSTLCWLPQETIVFDRASLRRRVNVFLSDGASFLAAEAIVFGRSESHERINAISVNDHWDIWRNRKLIHAERLAVGPQLLNTPATLASSRAIATVLFVSEAAGAALRAVQQYLNGHGAASCWNGKLVARIAADDGFQLRKQLKMVLSACLGGKSLPRVWTM